MGDNPALEIPRGFHVGKFPTTAPSAGMDRDDGVRIILTRGTYRIPRRRRLRVAKLLAGTAAGLLVGIPNGVFENTALPDGWPGRAHPAKVQQDEARKPEALHLAVAATIVAEPSSQTPLQLQIGLSHDAPSKTFVVLSGLPSGTSLSAGREIGTGEWMIPTSELSSLTMNVPADVSGKFEILITLFGGGDGTRTLTAYARTTLLAIVPEPLRTIVSAAPVELPSTIALRQPIFSDAEISPQFPTRTPDDQKHAERMVAQSDPEGGRNVASTTPTANMVVALKASVSEGSVIQQIRHRRGHRHYRGQHNCWWDGRWLCRWWW